MHWPLEQPLQLFLNLYELVQALPSVGFKADQDIDITIHTEVVAQHQSEQRECPDSPAAAEFGNVVTADCSQRSHRRRYCPVSVFFSRFTTRSAVWLSILGVEFLGRSCVDQMTRRDARSTRNRFHLPRLNEEK